MTDNQAEAATAYSYKTQEVQLKYAMNLLELLDVQPGDRVLDIGCGTGNLVELLAEKVGPNGHVHGLDPSSERMKVAQQKCKDLSNVSLVTAKSISLPVAEDYGFDHFITNTVLHWIPNDEKIVTFRRIFQALKPGGTFAGNITMRCPTNIALMTQLIESEYNVNLHGGDLYYVKPDWLRTNLEAIGFEVLKFEEDTYFVNLGSLDNYAAWYTATVALKYGVFDVNRAIQNYSSSIEWLTYQDGSMKHDSEVVVFLVRKPS